jgi:CBS domain-containing protein
MQIKDIVKTTSEVVHVDENLLDAAIRLRRDRLPALAVVDGDEIVGILTAAAVEAKLAAPDNDLGVAAVRDLMSAEIGVCHGSETIDTARRVMAGQGHQHLLVVDSDGKLCGVLSAADVQGDSKVTPGRDSAAQDHTVATAGRAKGDTLHHPNNYSVTPKLKDSELKD